MCVLSYFFAIILYLLCVLPYIAPYFHCFIRRFCTLFPLSPQCLSTFYYSYNTTSSVWHLYFLSTKKDNTGFFAPMMSFFLCLDCPAHFGGTRPSVCSALLRRRTDDVLRIVAVNPTLISLFERLLHKLVLSRVEGENCHSPARS